MRRSALRTLCDWNCDVRDDMKNDMRTGELFRIVVISVSLLLQACGNGALDSNGDPKNYTVGGTIANLLVDGLVLQNNGSDDLEISANSSSFTFPTAIADGEGYNVTVKTQPETQVCMITQASGTVSGANVTDVGVQCSLRPVFIIIRE